VAPRIAGVPGIVGVSLGGSVARGTDDESSDVDLGLYYSRAAPPNLDALRRLAADLDDRGAVELTDIGGWGPRINGGGWLVVDGRHVDWLYREVESVETAIADCRAGQSEPVHQPGHPWGWQPQVYAGEAAYGVSLVDPTGALERLRALALPYPDALRDAKRAGLWEARFTLIFAERAAGRGEPVLVAAALSRIAASLVDVVFAVNRRYLVNEKQAAEIGAGMRAPADSWDALSSILAAPGRSPADLAASVAAVRELVDAVDSWAASSLSGT
jgi:hypothetical protein